MDGVLFVLVIHITFQLTSHSFLVLLKKGATLTLKPPKGKKRKSKRNPEHLAIWRHEWKLGPVYTLLQICL